MLRTGRSAVAQTQAGGVVGGEAAARYRDKFGSEGNVRAEVLALPPGHPYLWLPLQFSVGLEPRLLSFVSVEELRRLRKDAESELQELARWGTTFTLIQSRGRTVA